MNEQELRDFNRKYQGSFISALIKNKGNKVVFSFDEAKYDAEGRVIIVSTTIDEGNASRGKLLLHEIEILDPPKSRVFDYKGVSYVYQHNPERQWMRGVCSNNTNLYTPLNRICELLHGNSFYLKRSLENDLFTLPVVEGIFRDKKLPLEEAVTQLFDTDVLSVCVNKHFFISHALTDNCFILWRLGNPLALFNVESREVELYDAIYSQEVRDFLMREDVFYHVKE